MPLFGCRNSKPLVKAYVCLTARLETKAWCIVWTCFKPPSNMLYLRERVSATALRPLSLLCQLVDECLDTSQSTLRCKPKSLSRHVTCAWCYGAKNHLHSHSKVSGEDWCAPRDVSLCSRFSVSGIISKSFRVFWSSFSRVLYGSVLLWGFSSCGSDCASTGMWVLCLLERVVGRKCGKMPNISHLYRLFHRLWLLARVEV